MNFENLLIDVSDGIMTITINRPDKLNALNRNTVAELAAAVELLESNPDIRAAVVTGSGEKAFVAGADIKEIAALDEQGGLSFAKNGQSVFNKIERSSKPVAAAVNGFALGGGCELAMACHFRYASESARFGQPEVNLGVIAGFGGTQRLPRLIGKGRAMELLLTGNMIDAAEAMRLGLVNRVVPAAELLSQTRQTLQTIIGKGPKAVALTIASINKGFDLDITIAQDIEAELFAKACASEDMKEGTAAFLEKRKPKFSGK
jgi:enoyl-CoA hydratase